jgi:hypothetical protein
VIASARKEVEARVVEAATAAGFPLPPGQLIPGEEPDFKVVGEFGRIGLEVTHVVPLPRNDSFNSALAENAHYQRVVTDAEAIYKQKPNAPAVKVTVGFWYFTKERGKKRRMAEELARFAFDHVPTASEPVHTFTRHDEIPDGFCVISIVLGTGTWFCGDDVTLTVQGIYETVGNRINEKDRRVATYRKNCPDAAIWLLMYSDLSIPGGIVIPDGFEKWTVQFEFDRVFLFSELSHAVVETSKPQAQREATA